MTDAEEHDADLGGRKEYAMHEGSDAIFSTERSGPLLLEASWTTLS